MKIFVFVFLAVALSMNLIAQRVKTDSIENKKIDGYFHPYKKTFSYEKTIAHPIKDAYLKYYAEDFVANRAIVHRQELYYENVYNDKLKQYIETKHEQNSFGIIDTLGNIIVSCKYENLSRIESDSISEYFIYRTKDSISLINLKGRKIVTLCNSTYQTLHNNQKTFFHFFISNTNYLRVGYNLRYNLYDIEKESFVLPSNHCDTENKVKIEDEEYQMVNYNNKFAIFCNIPYSIDYDDMEKENIPFDIYGNNINYIVYSLSSKEFSKPSKLAAIYNDSLVYIQNSTDSSWLCDDINELKNINDYDYIEAFPINPFNHSYYNEFNSWDKEYHDFLLVRKKGKYGIINLGNTILIPIIYDNIYLIDSTHFWLKKNDKWAIGNKLHELLTDFDFIDIEKMNAVNFTNFLFFTRLNPNIIGKDFHRFVSAHDADISSLANVGGLLKRFENTHSYYSRFWGSYSNNIFFAKKEDGYKLIIIINGVNLIVSASSFDNVFLATSKYSPGFQIGNKYGYSLDEIKYDRILLDLNYRKTYDFYGSYDKRIYISKELVVENGYIIGYRKYKKNRKMRIGKYKEQTWPY